MINRNCIEISAAPSWHQIMALGRQRLAADVTLLSETVEVWMARVRQRRDLLALDDAMLRDIGVTRSEVEAEANKPFWRC